MGNALRHAGCGGNIVRMLDGKLQCECCQLRIIDALELMPRGGWTPEHQRRRVFAFDIEDPATEEQIANTGALR